MGERPADVIEIVWRCDPGSAARETQPETAGEARLRLEKGSAAFASLGVEGGRYRVDLPPGALGLPPAPGEAIEQEPFAAVLGCADARVPAELVFGQAANDLFVVRVAGNVPGTECLGSLDYAVAHLHSVRLLTVVGHTGCGAVTSAADAFLDPQTYFDIARNPDLRAIIDAVMAAVTTAADALVAAHGEKVTAHPDYRDALIETAVVINAALTAATIQANVTGHTEGAPGVVFGVYDLARRSVGLPGEAGWTPGLADPPADAAALAVIARRTAAAKLG